MLYRKYRPHDFSQVVGQEHVVTTLKGALMTGRAGHAYLFSGPKGTGKTTIARIFAKALNCADFSKIFSKNLTISIPCNKCPACLAVNENRSLDLIEIDAASNRGIEDIRNLKESALVAAPGGGYKIFIIDEVHMLTKDAFNALLKILEEPPAHVVFILATTEAHKIPPTVLSRVQKFDFKRLNPGQVFKKLNRVADKEKIRISAEGLRAIALSCYGALRDAEVALSKIQAATPPGRAVSVDEVNEILGLIPSNYFRDFFSFLANGDKPAAIGLIHEVYNAGIDPEHFTKNFIEYLRKLLLGKVSPAVLAASGEEIDAPPPVNVAGQQLVRMLNIFSFAKTEIKTSPVPQLPLELAVMELIPE